MGFNSAIEWCHHTFNPWIGCSKVSAACKNCYAWQRDKRFTGGKLWGDDAERHITSDANWRKPLSWNRQAEAKGVRYRVFCASLADVFEDRADLVVPRGRLWRLIRATPYLDWLLLTKRPENIRRLIPWVTDPYDNVWLGTTAENQEEADRRVPHLVDAAAERRFISYEPALGLTDFSAYLAEIDWLIAGGESGKGARPMDEEWVRSVRDQCAKAGTSFFYKQKVISGKKWSLPLLDGKRWAEVPGEVR